MKANHKISRYTLEGSTEPGHQCDDYCPLCDIDWELESCSMSMNISYDVELVPHKEQVCILFENVVLGGFLQLYYFNPLGDERDSVIIEPKNLKLSINEDLGLRDNCPIDVELIINLNHFTAEIIFL